MDHQTFTSLFKDLISRLYDKVAVETHPLAAYFPIPNDTPVRRADAIQRLVLAEIEQLRPDDNREPQVQSPEWRPYIILHQRYVEGLDPHDIAVSLFIGDRQFRRDHSKALLGLSNLMWEHYFKSDENDIEEEQESTQTFEIHAENLDLNEVVGGVLSLASRRLDSEGVTAKLEMWDKPIPVHTDRILLRQMILSLLNFGLHLRSQPAIIISTDEINQPTISILIETDEQWQTTLTDELDSLEFVRSICQQLPAKLDETYPPAGKAGQVQLRLLFAAPRSKLVLVVDDQVTALKMYQRYLVSSGLEVIGLSDPSQALAAAREKNPTLILLDVMMPRMDGWEVLQSLKLDAQTKNIPIVVCSAWGEPELAFSLGAAKFLKKPIVQKDLLNTLIQLEIIEG